MKSHPHHMKTTLLTLAATLMTASILSNGRLVAAFGGAGGQPGALGINRIERVDGRIERLDHIGSAEMQTGDQFVIETPGGGGWGPKTP